MTESDQQHFYCFRASPAEMDHYWSDGWRHFGELFFRYQHAEHSGQTFLVIPLRIELTRFSLSRSQKRALGKNRDARLVVRPTEIDRSQENLFLRHRTRFQENPPSSLADFLSALPSAVPCQNVSLCIYLKRKLVAVTYLDIGAQATSAVYAMFDPAESQRSLGILMILQSIQLSIDNGFRYYYPGYAYREQSMYDYKKNFTGSEYLDWNKGWKPFVGCG